MLAKKVFYEDKHLENERLELTDKGTLYFLGRNLTLKSCTLVLKVAARNLFIREVQFINCTFEVKQELINHQDWITSSLKGCRFKGRLSGCDFGHWPEYGKEPKYQLGSIEDCDFSEARLDHCRFHGDDPRSLRFPKWPGFTILDPIRHIAELRDLAWPERFGSSLLSLLDQSPENRIKHPRSTMALSFYAPVEAKKSGTAEEVFKAAIAKCDFIVS
ncbi:hypothetical protein BO221_32055 [Archangium sp. Cb G35]|uniref:hypothetical protein n=1 Tax=Archangium sp. Cb G35 TaxID=1920190 RepID=UPI000936C548|nr:hypothetical protein [Archangium sp. Cb G35]OJT20619.1 hypothetical protein BO221_32055 [Archangium sp. Cb G35]